ncbi:transcription termination factor NusB [Staphylococcus xylosus]|uniref:transcription termination factor NusB n=1 Tax=Staphylococcus xylosus TaxID=1288 RepID=UPI002DBD1AF8|nr:transcription termination factor NusB [Staphylococcus xylosus]MEB7830999.1 transcription termination factor NusB [Staphylococcus xylosus]
MGLQLNKYINSENRKLDKKVIRQHLIDILFPELANMTFDNEVKKSEKIYENQNKCFPSISLTKSHKIKINEVSSNLKYKSITQENKKFNVSEELGEAS